MSKRKPARQIEQEESAHLRQAIIKLFADARDCVDHECAALVEWKRAGPDEFGGRCVFECIASVRGDKPDHGLWFPERSYVPYGPTRAQTRDTLKLVKKLFPNHAKQRVLFRTGPFFEYRTPDCPLPSLWLRLGAVPLDVNEFIVRV